MYRRKSPIPDEGSIGRLVPQGSSKDFESSGEKKRAGEREVDRDTTSFKFPLSFRGRVSDGGS